jgi:hypothetical protein
MIPLFFTALTKSKNNFSACDCAALVATTPFFAPPLNKSNRLINPVATAAAIDHHQYQSFLMLLFS